MIKLILVSYILLIIVGYMLIKLILNIIYNIFVNFLIIESIQLFHQLRKDTMLFLIINLLLYSYLNYINVNYQLKSLYNEKG